MISTPEILYGSNMNLPGKKRARTKGPIWRRRDIWEQPPSCPPEVNFKSWQKELLPIEKRNRILHKHEPFMITSATACDMPRKERTELPMHNMPVMPNLETAPNFTVYLFRWPEVFLFQLDLLLGPPFLGGILCRRQMVAYRH